MSRGRVVVIGGGLAGVTAALDLTEAGFAVELLETRSRLGGATYSFQRGDLVVDTGQHVFLRCYTAYLDLLRRLGAQDAISIQRRFQVPVLSPAGRASLLHRWNLPAPGHLLPALLAYRQLTATERARVARTSLALRKLDPDDPALDEVSLGEWLRQHGESPRAVTALWGLLGVAALNAVPDEASMLLAAKVFRTGVLDRSDSADIGIPRIPLAQLHGDSAQRALLAAGAEVRVRCRARAIRRAGAGFHVFAKEGANSREFSADAVVLAVPHQAAAGLLADLPVPGAERWAQLSAAPIVNVHLHYDRQITGLPMAAVLDSPVQWVFDRSAISGAPHGQYLAISLSAADEYVDLRTEDLRALFVPALQQLFPAARRARLLDFFVTREPSATFRQAPGTAAIRPDARTPVPGLVLAGAWTGTGWPDTTEGAVRSGARAAQVVTADQRRHHGVEVTA
ncbi:squalene-associated FAD-dependent desaturase [Saccharopolyspora kobensis]|uniref:Squalene-associated FAD-dependent desaturase n=1 Tax=Saccharopolyspora kobensis TaxID=146035 RepID=A0A1H5W8Y8_9PSEU|nr:hydroxysqualene dehydroxylase HpnE [Saccharopolyspora kobensis]SEF96019.1 squalene-associated FAD-dependent desaturase [Saccharopolyspora kobensis]SFD73525.1 squalene-associated FAD-dependent desaturase [Saccharopolyspora kobensis]